MKINQIEVSVNQSSVGELLKIFSEIIKIRITVLVTLTTALGYILASHKIGINLFYAVFGIFLLACSASALNHYQEKDLDYMMSRTKNRPIPSGRISSRAVLLISAILFFTGAFVLLYGTNVITAGIGIFTLLWYNAVYTPMKKISTVAIIPGSLVGALPPLAGWTAAGGNIFSPEIFLISLYFFLWQIPHFWLLLMLYGDEYEGAGFPVLNRIVPDVKFKLITIILISITAVFGFIISFSDILSYNLSRILLTSSSVILIYYVLKFYQKGKSRKEISGMFFKINIYTLLFIVILSADKLVLIL